MWQNLLTTLNIYQKECHDLRFICHGSRSILHIYASRSYNFHTFSYICVYSKKITEFLAYIWHINIQIK